MINNQSWHCFFFFFLEMNCYFSNIMFSSPAYHLFQCRIRRVVEKYLTYHLDSSPAEDISVIYNIDTDFCSLYPLHSSCFSDTDSSPPNSAIAWRNLCIPHKLSHRSVRHCFCPHILCTGLFRFVLKRKKHMNTSTSTQFGIFLYWVLRMVTPSKHEPWNIISKQPN